jgi:hypothetical protein
MPPALTPANSIGWRFFVDKEITITHLGLYDAGDEGLSGTHYMGIWRVKKTGGLRLERWVNIGPDVPNVVAEDQHVYVPLSAPLTIIPDPVPHTDGNYERWLVGVWSPAGSTDLRTVQPQGAGTLAIQQAGIIRLENYTYTNNQFWGTPNTALGDVLLAAQRWYPWGNTSPQYYFGVNFKYGQPGPAANAGPDVAIYTSEQSATTIVGTGGHTDPSATIQYRWLDGEVVLPGWTPVGLFGMANLSLAEPVLPLGVGEHTLTLEVTDGDVTASDTMLLTVYNSPPNSQPSTVQTVEIGVGSVNLEGSVSDFDGDQVSYQWVVNGELVGSLNSLTASPGGEGVGTELVSIAPADSDYSRFSLGENLVQLWVADGKDHGAYTPVFGSVTVVFQDTTQPVVTATADSPILWPPSGELRPVTISATTRDNSGGPVQLGAVVTSNESDGSGESDWTEPVIDAATGTIVVNLRAERLATGDGRVYTVTVTATDESGNDSSVDVKIRVPHDRRKK